MNKTKLLIAVLVILFSTLLITLGAIFVTQNFGMVALIIFGGVSFLVGTALLGMTFTDE